MGQKVVTKVWVVDNDVESTVENMQSCTQIVYAAHLLKADEAVAFPTETVYGLGANALSNVAVEKIFAAKGRPSDNPLIVHIAKKEQLSTIASEVPAKAEKLMEAFWPGPLTIILPRTDEVASLVTAGLDSVGVRMPDHPIALALIAAANLPIAAPSANRSGRPSPTTAAHVLADLEGRVAGVVDGGATGVGLESTVIDVTVEPPVILRPGGITREQLEEVIGSVDLDPSFQAGAAETPRAPGMKYTHYAPEGEMWLVEGGEERVRVKMADMLHEAKQHGRRTGVLATEETAAYWRANPDADIVLSVGSRTDLGEVAHQLYAVLREFDNLKAQFIVGETFSREGLGMAVMNRLEKAAGGRIERA
ncbi:L-threonylcarbamoyladenylate synthase [Brevibacillus choshinensis]|uniref:Threonylcarbamoyl-AMP synthase n=1 Tax=Brevibacillus choshinensis TaxID=54911 RepID=A0ABX7FMB7_BRECH|nr:L-threonylcarbamoyladenylate synthase [Brevibacillus choshinensis]QRG67398.1 threonylcarbamoyl-AMP synthase [Brevibacillus choshinensis]